MFLQLEVTVQSALPDTSIVESAFALTKKSDNKAKTTDNATILFTILSLLCFTYSIFSNLPNTRPTP